MKRNVFYFLKKHGMKTFDEFPFNEVDALIFSSLSYVQFWKYVPSLSEKKEGISLSKLTEDDIVVYKMCEGCIDEPRNRALLLTMRNKKRYQDVILQFYEDSFDASVAEQFSAITFLIPNAVVIAFRGTDPTFIGWKENFNLSFLDEIPAQEKAREYLNQVARRTKEKIYLCGHSKGGNLADHAALRCYKKARSRIAGVFNFDGPGFLKDVFAGEAYEELKDKMYKYIPKSSIVGLLMNHSKDFIVIKAAGFWIIQHDLFLWKVNKKGHIHPVKNNSYHSRVFERANQEWINSISKEDRILFTDTLCEVLCAVGNVGVFDIKKHPIVYIRSVKRRFKKLEKAKRKLLRETLHSYFRISRKTKKELKKEKSHVRKK